MHTTLKQDGTRVTIAPADDPVAIRHELQKVFDDIGAIWEKHGGPSGVFMERDPDILPDRTGLYRAVILLDTDIAIQIAGRQVSIEQRVLALNEAPVLSLISMIELEDGVRAKPEPVAQRRQALDRLMRTIAVLPVDPAIVTAYGQVVGATGFPWTRA